MSKAKGYSLWLMPSGEIYDRLSRLISRLAEKYNTPRFEPHVTLLGGILGSEEDILSRTSQLASVARPYEIEFGKIRYLDSYFRCLFLSAKQTAEVMMANKEAREIFGRQDDPGYMPHLSLMYADFQPQAKEKIIAGIGKEFDIGFAVNSICLFSTTGEPREWYKVKEFPLK